MLSERAYACHAGGHQSCDHYIYLYTNYKQIIKLDGIEVEILSLVGTVDTESRPDVAMRVQLFLTLTLKYTVPREVFIFFCAKIVYSWSDNGYRYIDEHLLDLNKMRILKILTNNHEKHFSYDRMCLLF